MRLTRRRGAGLVAVATLLPMLAATGAAAATPSCQGVPATIVGTADRDLLVGTPKADVIFAGAGSDTVRGRGGDDLVCGGDGADRLHGGAGADRLYGGRGQLILADRSGRHLEHDRLTGGPGDDVLVGGRDGRPYESPVPDTVDYGTATRGITVDLAAGTATGQGHDVLSAQKWLVYGSDHDDTILGSALPDRMSGGLGADFLAGRGGPDHLAGDPFDDPDRARDTLLGHGGDDYLVAGSGDDLLLGGPGDDELSDWGASADVIRGHRGDDWISDTIVPGGVQALRGGPGRNRLHVSTKLPTGELSRVAGSTDLRTGLTTVLWSPPTVVATSGFTDLDMPQAPWTFYGTDAPEVFRDAYDGRRTIYAGGGDDYLGGGRRVDHLDGGAGRDRAFTDRGVDTCVSVELFVDAPCEVILPAP